MLVWHQWLVTAWRRRLAPLHRHQLQAVVPIQLQHVPLLILQLHLVPRTARHVDVGPAGRPQGVLLPPVQHDRLGYDVHLAVPGGAHYGPVRPLEHHRGVGGADALVGVDDGEVPAVVADLWCDFDNRAILHLHQNGAFRAVGSLLHDAHHLGQALLLHQDLHPQRCFLPIEAGTIAVHASAVATVFFFETQQSCLHGQHLLTRVRVNLNCIRNFRQLILNKLVLHPPGAGQPPQRLQDLIPDGLRCWGFGQRAIVRLVVVLGDG
mmetsp:Transcript_3376/g.7619  ORF Transcript_3376/g.7619 Transcript_3376/m.7619 type:complete len:265 (-) Transcript_3376:227-1021(-)